MSSYKITGTIKVLNQTVQVSEKFSKRELVLTESEGMYPQHISFQFTQDKCSLLDGFQVGEAVQVSFNLSGREWTSPQGEVKYFNSLDAWRIDKAIQPKVVQPIAPPAPIPFDESQDSDLPF